MMPTPSGLVGTSTVKFCALEIVRVEDDVVVDLVDESDELIPVTDEVDDMLEELTLVVEDCVEDEVDFEVVER